MSLRWKAASLPSRFLFVSFTILNVVVIGLAQPDYVLKTQIDTQANSQRLSSILEEPPPDPETPFLRTTVVCSAYPQLEKECLDVNREFYNYQRQALLQRTAIFRFHHISTIIIFVMVLILVLAGLFFAGVQFFRSLPTSSPANIEEGAIPPPTPSTLKVGPLGFEITTSILGDDYLMTTALDKAAYPGRLAASFKYDRGFRTCREVLVELLSFGLDLFALTDFAFWTKEAYVTFPVTKIHADRERT